MRKSIITKTATVIAGGAAALSLSACGFQISFGNTDGQQQEEQTRDRNADDQQQNDENQNNSQDQQNQQGTDSGADQNTNSGSGSGSASGSGSGSGRGSGSGSGSGTGSGAGSGTNTSSDSSSGSTAADGTPVIKDYQLEKSIKEQAEQQSGISGITVDCNDLRADYVGATTSCTMDVPGDKKYFPLAKVTSIDGNYVKYELKFPGVDF